MTAVSAATGSLIAVVGPSGAGKDRLIGLARRECNGNAGIIFPRRIVTRDASPAENNISLDEAAFAAAAKRGEFAVQWRAHGLSYALPVDIGRHLGDGRIVIVNVSRAVVPALRATYPRVIVVEITAPAHVLTERLTARARASDGAIDARLQRAVSDPALRPDVIIENVGPAETHAQDLVAVIRDCSLRST